MSDKDFKVKNKLTIAGLTNASGVLLAQGHDIDSHSNLVTQYGGTGTTTSPTSGQILYSASGTTYAPTTLKTLDVKGASYSNNAPANPVVGQIWVESDADSDSFDPNIIRRKSFTATAAQTVFTTDLEFIQGYEQVFFNGMLLLRNSDYTTASNTNVTLAAGAAAGDIVEVVTVTNLNSVNTYTQGEIDTALSAKLSTSTAASTYLTQANAATTYVPQTSYSVAGKNFLINGLFDFWQRSTDITSSTVSGTFYAAADRWQTWNGAGASTRYQRISDADSGVSQYSYRIQRVSGSTTATNYQIVQNIETSNSKLLVGKTMTLSFRVKKGANFSPTSGTMIARVQYNNNTNGNAINQATSTAFTGTFSPTTSFATYSVTGTIPSSGVSSVMFNLLWEPTGTAGADDWLEISAVQLEIGSVATSFSRAGGNIQAELAACQRYYVRLLAATNMFIGQGQTRSGTIYSLFGAIPLPTSMRTSPSLAINALIAEDNSGGGLNVTTVFANTTPNNAGCYFQSASNWGGNYGVLLRGTSGAAYMEASAEL